MSRAIRKANQASAAELSVSLSDPQILRDTRYELQVFTSSELSDGDKKAIWTLFEQNMHDLYVSSSFGWNEAAKRQELFHTLSRFVVVRRDETKDNGEPAKREGPVKPIVAFTMFRFDREEGENVVYCYELQVHREMRRAGLGRFLVEQLLSIGPKWGMKKIMLTVLKTNQSARQFYKALGFELDPTSPGHSSLDEEWVDNDEESEECDYEILSRAFS
ncbi:hypothetical protein AcW2_000723 [Taiwanofungus camphoratus]|nr:hypothetical protein AcW2_000723 [Antrodia cinnamomea]